MRIWTIFSIVICIVSTLCVLAENSNDKSQLQDKIHSPNNDEDISVRRLLLRSRRETSNSAASSADESAEESDVKEEDEEEKADETKPDEVSEVALNSSSNLTETSSSESSSTSKVEENEESGRRTDDDLNFEKPKPSKKVNWTEIEEEWNAVMEDDKVREKWDKIDEKLKSGIRSVLRSIFPKVVAMSSDTKVSSNCTAGMLKWIISLRNLKEWSVKMLDAIGKPTAGIMEGAVTMFGNHRQCMRVRAFEEEDEDLEDLDDEDRTSTEERPERKEFFRGKYCVLEFKPHLPHKPPFYGFNTRLKALQRPVDDDTIFKPMTELAVFLNFISFRFDLCVPSLCTREDIQKIVSFISKQIDFRGRVTRCETEQDHLPSLNLPQLSALCMLSACFLLFASCTVATFLLLRCGFRGTLSQFLYNLSWQHSYRELSHFANYQKSHLKAPALYGVRYLVMMWVMTVHTAAFINFQFLRDLLPLKDLALSQYAQVLTKSAVQMDSLILITAFTMAYACEGASFNRILRYVIKKFFRIMPAVMLVVGFIVLLPLARTYMNGGPTWEDFVPRPAHACEKTGIYNLFFIQNFIHPDRSCLPHTWLFCVELQLALLFIPIMALRDQMPQVANLLNCLLIVVGYISNVTTTSRLRLPPTFMITLPDPSQRNYYYYVHYFMPWTHLSTFACGVLVGSFVAKIKREKQLKHERHSSIHYNNTSSAAAQVGYLIGWATCICVVLSVLFSYNDWIKGDLPDPMTAGFYEASQRVSWCLAQCYMLYYLLCVMDENSLVVRILSHKSLIFIGRLTILAYVIHPVWQLIFLGTQHTQIYSGVLMMVYSVVGNITMSYVLAAIIAFLFEIPLCSLLISRDIVSSSHPVRPLLAKHLLGHQDKQNQSSVYPLGGQLSDTDGGNHFANFKYNGGLSASAALNGHHPNHNPHHHHHHHHHGNHTQQPFSHNNNNNNTMQKNNNELSGLHVVSSGDESMKENSKF